MKVIFSFVIDTGPLFVFGGWHLARSLIEHCAADPGAIHVQCTCDVAESDKQLFRDQGYQVHDIARFGDGRFCNKLGQIDNLLAVDCDCVVLLDTDMIATADLRPFLNGISIQGRSSTMPIRRSTFCKRSSMPQIWQHHKSGARRTMAASTPSLVTATAASMPCRSLCAAPCPTPGAGGRSGFCSTSDRCGDRSATPTWIRSASGSRYRRRVRLSRWHHRTSITSSTRTGTIPISTLRDRSPCSITIGPASTRRASSRLQRC